MAKDGTNRGGARAGAGAKKKPLADKIAEGNPGRRKLTVIDFQDTADLEGQPISAMSAGFLRRGLRQVFPRGFGKPMRPCCWNTPSSRRSMRSTSSAVQGICTASCRLTKTQQL